MFWVFLPLTLKELLTFGFIYFGGNYTRIIKLIHEIYILPLEYNPHICIDGSRCFLCMLSFSSKHRNSEETSQSINHSKEIIRAMEDVLHILL